MSWIFHKVKLRKFKDFPGEWVLQINASTQLLDYWMITYPAVVQSAFMDHIKTITKKCHYTDRTAYVVDMRAQFGEISFVESLVGFMEDIFNGMEKILQDGQVLYIRAVGSYTFDTPDQKLYEILETKKLTELIFPTMDELKIMKWPQGNHWYATIGKVDIVVDGKMKWDSYTEAKRAAKKFIKDTLNDRKRV